MHVVVQRYRATALALLLTRETAPWLRCRFATSKCFQNEKKPETRPNERASEIPDRSIYRTSWNKTIPTIKNYITFFLKSYPFTYAYNSEDNWPLRKRNKRISDVIKIEEITTWLLNGHVSHRGLLFDRPIPVPVARFLFFQRENKAKLVNSWRSRGSNGKAQVELDGRTADR